MPTHKEKKFDQGHSNSKPFGTWNKAPTYVQVPVSSWNNNPEICFEGLDSCCDDGMGGSGGSDDDDNLAYAKISESLKGHCKAGQTPSVFTYSRSFPGGQASWRVMKLAKDLYLTVNGSSSFNKECFISLIDYAEEELKTEYLYVLLPKQDNHAHRSILLSFRFMGFKLLPLSDPVSASVSSLDYIVLRYDLESSDSEGEDDDGD